MDLTKLGWTASLAEAFRLYPSPEGVPARVASENKHFYSLVMERGELTGQVSGKLLHDTRSPADLPKVGDWVVASMMANEDKAVIHHVLPRRTRLSRKVPGRETEEQVLATNIDLVFVVHPLDGSFNPRRMQRHLVMVRESGARPVVVLNKSDLCRDVEEAVRIAQAVAGSEQVLAVSARTGAGMKHLEEIACAGVTIVTLGSSGVGKSSLINRLYGEDILGTAEVRETDLKGRHMTSWREMIQLPSGALVIDTPGTREFHMWADEAGVAEAFSEIEALAAGCQFRDCQHRTEKKCAVKAAVEAGQLSRDRYESFLKLRGEAERLGKARTVQGYLEKKRRAKAIHQDLKKFYADDGR